MNYYSCVRRFQKQNKTNNAKPSKFLAALPPPPTFLTVRWMNVKTKSEPLDPADLNPFFQAKLDAESQMVRKC